MEREVMRMSVAGGWRKETSKKGRKLFVQSSNKCNGLELLSRGRRQRQRYIYTHIEKYREFVEAERSKATSEHQQQEVLV